MKIVNIRRKTMNWVLLLAGMLLLVLILYTSFDNVRYLYYKSSSLIPEKIPVSPVEQIPAEKRTTPDLILLGARQEAINQTRYDGSYQAISYPGGDVSSEVGACTDVIVRAYRNAGIDLQKLIHEDMQKNFQLYPQKWGLDVPDPNIDHRRIPNQVTFFNRHGTALTMQVKNHTTEWQWGDIVYWRFATGEEHCGIVSDRRTSDGIPLVIHNAGMAVEQDCLERWEITGHFRYYGD